ncbi:hypothetical protein G6O69_04920 [Pseudenhygromyxa sp. WMMC2535]|uniref:hypothetical protein n=1 Tax=Pseudenhygromyxa sp. WMMC2535 TaxID=2712867 RepID=UPI001557FEC6|nr:hypothetical protein [Pseudenhygromyxa sp. WMMC2535]NVB37162.1 hypothetical protein [Pseudenhygromyxa sp. WMMC2535]
MPLHPSFSRAATSLALSAALLISTTASASGRLEPEDAAAKRDEVSASLPEDAEAAAEALHAAAEALGDPELFLAAADKLRFEAASTRDQDLAEAARPHAQTARDVAIYLADERNYDATDWHPVERERAQALVGEADQALREIDTLIAEIEEERRKAEEAARLAAGGEGGEAKAEKPKRDKKPGTGLIAGGSVGLVVGVGGLAVLGVGLAQGGSLQREAETLDLPAEQDQLDDLDRRGKQANTLAIVGGVVGGVGLATGVALIVLGVKKRKQAGPGAEARRLDVGPYYTGHGAGLTIQGSF